MTKWEKVVNEWKTRQQEANQSENQTSHTEPTHSSTQETTSDEPPQDNEYDRDGNDDDSVDAEITAETVFEDDPVAYASVWDVGDREPYIDLLFLFETLLCFNSWVRVDSFWESNPESPEAKATSTASLESVRIMMDGIRRYAPMLDKKGKLMTNGWMIPKFHNLVHIV